MSKRKPAAMTASKQQPSQAETPRVAFKSPEFRTLMKAFREVIGDEGVIGLEGVQNAGPGEYPFTPSQFRQAFETVMEDAPGKKAKVRGMGVSSKIYKGMEFMVISGSSYSVWKAPKA